MTDLVNPFEGVSKGFMIPEKSTAVKAMVPTGKHVSHANDLKRVKGAGASHKGYDAQLRTWHKSSSEKSAMPVKPGRVKKSSFGDINKSESGSRGTPMTDISRQARHGRRLVANTDFSKAGGDWKNYFSGSSGASASAAGSRSSSKAQYNRSTAPGGRNKFFAGSAGSAMPKKPGRFARILRRAR